MVISSPTWARTFVSAPTKFFKDYIDAEYRTPFNQLRDGRAAGKEGRPLFAVRAADRGHRTDRGGSRARRARHVRVDHAFRNGTRAYRVSARPQGPVAADPSP